jgi:phosphoribosylamine--glycine ligase
MKVLVVGKGAAEHALIWKLNKSKHVEKIYCSPGNAGIAELAECIEINPPDLETYLDFIKYEWIDLIVVNEIEMLINGLVDVIEREGFRVLGLRKSASRLRYRRSHIYDLLKSSGFHLPQYRVFTSFIQAQEYIMMKGFPIVIKTDDITNDEDMFVSYTIGEAMNALKKLMKIEDSKVFSKKILIEELISGDRVTFVAFTDGKTISRPIAMYKYMYSEEGEKGSYTSGMGAYSIPDLNKYDDKYFLNIEKPLLKVFNVDDVNFRGIFSVDLIIDGEQVYVADLKCYLGDPEIQTVIPLLGNDILEVFLSITDNKLSNIYVVWQNLSSICVVISKKKYGERTSDVLKIRDLDKLKNFKNLYVFHNETLFNNDEIMISNKKVLSITRVGETLKEVREDIYKAISELSFEGIYFRKDIGLI